jgi:hypothetical protein
MKKLLLITLGIWAINITHLSAQQINTCFPKITNGYVNTMLLDEVNNKLYVGGSFSGIGNFKPDYAQIDKITGQFTSQCWPESNSSTNSIVSDGNGGWFIGGSFTKIGDSLRNRLAHISPAGSVTAWNPGANGSVKIIKLVGNTLYVGGQFTIAGGQTRNNIAALDVTVNTNSATAWDPNADDIIHEIEINGNTVYVGGEFHNIGGQVRNCIAAIDATINTNNATAWNPGYNHSSINYIKAIAVSGNTVYLGGSFLAMGGSTRYNLAAVDATINTANATAWNPNPGTSGTITNIEISGTTVYITGNFTLIGGVGGQSRNGFAALDATINTNNVTAWYPALDGAVYYLLIENDILYIAGSFNTVNGLSRSKAAALDLTASTNYVTAWSPPLITETNYSKIAVNENQVLVAGGLIGVTHQRKSLAQIDLNDYTVTDWNPGADGIVRALTLNGTTLYVGGDFDSIGGQIRRRVGAINTTINTNNATAWNPNPVGSSDTVVNAIEYAGNVVYVGGTFTTIGGQSRKNIAAIDASTGNATAWDPNPGSGSAFIKDILVNGNTIYVAGSFGGTIGGQSRSNIAALDATINTNNATAWNPGSSGGVNSMVLDGTTLYVVGSFTTSIGGSPRNHIAALNTTVNTNNVTAWNPSPSLTSGEIDYIDKRGNIIYIAGNIGTIGTELRTRIAALDATINTNNATSWYPDAPGNVVYSIKSNGTSVFVVGAFIDIAGEAWRGIAAFTAAATCAVSPSFELYPDSNTEHNWFAVNTSTGIAPMSYTWYWGDGSFTTGTNPSHVYDSAGYYNICVTVTDGTGCANSYCDNSTYVFKTAAEMVTINVVNQLPTAVAEKENGLLRVYPNPANSILTIETVSGKGFYQLQDITGKVLLSGSVTATKFSLDISSLSKGIYLLSLIDGEQQVNRKVVKE